MNQMYLKRIVQFLSISLAIAALIVVSGFTNRFIRDYHNLADTDKLVDVLLVLFLIVVVFSPFGIFKKQRWGWICMVSFAFYLPISYLLNINIIETAYPPLVTIPFSLLFVGVGIFLLSKSVITQYAIKSYQITIACLLPFLLYFITTIDPIYDASKVNSLYLTITEDDVYYLNNSLFTGEVYSNNSNGNLELIGRTLKGLPHGEWKIFHDNGQIKNHYHYKNGQLEGLQLTYFSTGEKRKEITFKNGQANGRHQSWYAPNKIHEKGRWVLDKKEGEWIVHQPNVDFMTVETYSNDSLINTEYIDQND